MPDKLIGLMKVRNEQWVLELSLPAALLVCDELVILDHCSTDATAQILQRFSLEYGSRLHCFKCEDPQWKEAALRQSMLEFGRSRGGTSFYSIDADELISGNLIGSLRDWINELGSAESLWLPWLALWRNLDRYRDDDSIWSKAYMAVAFRDSPEISYTDGVGDYDIHARLPGLFRQRQRRRPSDKAAGGLLHLQFANWRRLRAKHAWYKMIETARWPGRSTPEQLNWKYNRALDESGLQCSPVPESWWHPYQDLRSKVRFDDAPWHEKECLQLWREHGAEAFRGLELWGVPEIDSPEE